MKPTVEAVLNQARSLIGDDEVAGGEIFTDTILLPYFQQAMRELWLVLRGAQDPFVLTEAYVGLPANQAVLDPASVGLLNFAEPEGVKWTTSGAPVAISAVAVSGGNASVTATGHGLTVGSAPNVVVYGVLGFAQFNNPNNLWTASVPDANHVTLNGCTAADSYSSGGFLSNVTGDAFTEMTAQTQLIADPNPADPTSAMSQYAWIGGVFRFVPSTQARLLIITYRQSGIGISTTTDSVPIDDTQDYLATRTAGLAGKARGAASRGQELNMEAIGPSLVADGSGGLLAQLVRIDVRNLQRVVYRRPPFRSKRNLPGGVLF